MASVELDTDNFTDVATYSALLLCWACYIRFEKCYRGNTSVFWVELVIYTKKIPVWLHQCVLPTYRFIVLQ